jgi:hypothetical protein
MKFTMAEILRINDGLSSLLGGETRQGERVQPVELPPVVGLKLGQLAKKLTPLIEPYIEQQNKLVTRLGKLMDPEKPSSKKRLPQPGDDTFEEFDREIKEMRNAESEVAFTPIKLDELRDTKLPSNFWVTCSNLFTE